MSMKDGGVPSAGQPPPHERSPDASRSVANPAAAGTLLGTLAHLWPYIWPSDRLDLRLRVIGSLVLLLFAKLATIAVPFTFKWATDALAGHADAPAGAAQGALLDYGSPGRWRRRSS